MPTKKMFDVVPVFFVCGGVLIPKCKPFFLLTTVFELQHCQRTYTRCWRFISYGKIQFQIEKENYFLCK